MEPVHRRLAALFVVALVLFVSPLLGAVNRPAAWAGLPVLPLYLFAGWAAVIAVAWAILRRGPR